MEASRGCVIGLDLVSPLYLTSSQSSVLVDTSGRARITDFGLASVTHDLYLIWNPSDEHRHGARWIAPEILDDRGTYTKEADVFSFAMVMIEVRYRSPTRGWHIVYSNKDFH